MRGSFPLLPSRMKIQVIVKYTDRFTGEVVHSGSVIDVTQERGLELIAKGRAKSLTKPVVKKKRKTKP